jgi:hypothetical protein
MKKTLALVTVCSLVAVACGGSESGDDMEGMPMSGVRHTVSILEPADGSTVTGPALTVRLATNVPIVQAGDMTPGTGHHHLFLDGDLSPEGEPIPAVPGTVVHLGNGASEFTFDAVSPGRHRLIALVADGAHFPLVPFVVDTVMFTVQ